jgi:hypothetical protein
MKINTIISIVCVALLLLLVQTNRQLSAVKQQLTFVNDSLTSVKDKYNREVATSKILQMEKKDLVDIAKIYKSKYDLEKMKPAKIVYLQSSKIETKHDTIIKTSIEYTDSMPTYIVQDSSQWHTIRITAKADSSHIYWSVNNKYITTHYNSAPFWKAPQYHIQTINLNPHTQTKEQLSYQLKPNKANRLLWFGAGLLTSYIITRK